VVVSTALTSQTLIIWSLGVRCTATANALAVIGQATSTYRWAGIGWGARGCGASNVGVQVQGVTDTFEVGGSNFFGSIGVQLLAHAITMSNNSVTCNMVSVNGTACIDVAAGATVNSQSNTITGVMNVEGVITNLNDVLASNGGDPCIQPNGATAIVNLDTNDTVCSNVAGAKAINFFGTAGAIVNVGMNHTFDAILKAERIMRQIDLRWAANRVPGKEEATLLDCRPPYT
jgi:hypothetical protein